MEKTSGGRRERGSIVERGIERRECRGERGERGERRGERGEGRKVIESYLL